jgi:hypothetical protein
VGAANLGRNRACLANSIAREVKTPANGKDENRLIKKGRTRTMSK